MCAWMGIISFWIADVVIIGTGYLDKDGNGYYIVEDL